MDAYAMPFEALVVLECGAYSTGEETKLLRAKNRCFYMDAVEEHVTAFRRSQSGVDPSHVFHYALTDSNGHAEFTIADGLTGNSSLQHCASHLADLATVKCSFRKVTVPCISYDTLQSDILGAVIDLLILDIEGGEVQVLRSWKHLSPERLPKLLCIEAGYNWLTRKALLLDLGYVIDFYSFNNVVLHHSSFHVQRNEDYIRAINLKNPKFVYNSKLIFENDLIPLTRR
jgi:FkbM family methyltransferase